MAKAPYVASVVNPLTSQGASGLSKDRATGYLSVTVTENPGALSVDDAQTIIDAAQRPAAVGGDRGPDGRPARSEGVQAGDRVERADRDRRRDGDPHVRLRDRGRDGAAHLQRDRGPRRDAVDRLHPQPCDDRLDRGADPGHDDRPGRRDRLRAVHRHAPPSRTPGRRWNCTSRSPARSRPPVARSPSPAGPSPSPCSRSRSPTSRW